MCGYYQQTNHRIKFCLDATGRCCLNRRVFFSFFEILISIRKPLVVATSCCAVEFCPVVLGYTYNQTLWQCETLKFDLVGNISPCVLVAPLTI